MQINNSDSPIVAVVATTVRFHSRPVCHSPDILRLRIPVRGNGWGRWLATGSSSASGCGEPYVRNEANLIEGRVYPISVYACVNPVIRRQMMTRYEMVGAQAALS